MEITTFAPVLIPTLNRYEHFRRCVESLSRCTHANSTELVIGIDYPPADKYYEGYKRICDFLPQISGFKKVTVFDSNENLGVIENFNRLKKYAASNYDRYILTEDDNEFSPCFLDFMNKCLTAYKDNPKVISVCGFNQYTVKDKSLIFTYDASAWGIGRWKNKCNPTKEDIKQSVSVWKTAMKLYRVYPALLFTVLSTLRHNKTYGDANWTCYGIANEKYQVRPSVSLVRNWGHDGSGVHCGVTNDDDFVGMKISDELIFDFQNPVVERTTEIDHLVKNNMMPSSFIKRLIFKMKIFAGFLYIKIFK